MAYLVIDLVGGGDGVGDLVTQELAVAFAKAVRGNPRGRFGRVQLPCRLGVIGRVARE